MGHSNSHRKISTGCVILIAICTIGLHAILVAATTSSSEHIIEPSKSLMESSIEDSGIEKISSSDDDLQKSETKDGKVEIIKQIQKVNTDGSYTVGYEAEDGTFKIESRDVLGNVKGTFGYIDLNGEIKRVSYTANNGTGLKNTETSSSEEENQQQGPPSSPVRFNRTLVSSSTTRRPVYSSTTAVSPTRGTVVQAIPRRFRVSPLGGSSSTEKPSYREYLPSSTTKQIRNGDPTTTVIYATSVPTPKPYINIRPTPLPGTNLRQTSEQQINRPDKLEINNHHSQVQISSNRDISASSTTKPVVEDIDEKDEEKIILRAGNALRRELQSDSYVSQGDGSLTSATRPLYSTTNNPKIPTLVLKARQRALQIQNSLNGHTDNTEKYYIRSAQKKIMDVADEPTTESTSEHAYLTQSPIQDQIPPNRMSQQKTDLDNRVLRKSEQRIPQFVRIHPHRNNMPQLIRLPIPQQINENEQYLRETTPIPSKAEQIAEQDPISIRVPQQQQPIYNRIPPMIPPSGYYPNQQQERMPGYYAQSSPPPYPYRDNQGAYVPPYYDNPIGNTGYQEQERPLTTRDFERLLHLLVVRHQYLQRSNPYLPYDPYYNGYQQSQQYSRPLPPPIYNPYDLRSSYRQPPTSPYYPTTENMYQAQNPIPQSELNPMEYELQRLMPRKKQYNNHHPRYFGLQQSRDEYAPSAPQSQQVANYLPPDVREELLYRMLMLALQSEPHGSIASSPSSSKHNQSPGDSDSELNITTKPPNIVYRKPVRSVQILGEEN